MAERKVLNKYIAPDYDPEKLPKLKIDRDGPSSARTMLPMSMKCDTCGNYMAMGKKFNCKKETAKGMDYLGIKRLRFLIKCDVCKANITFLTDPKTRDYEVESGATRTYDFRKEERDAAAEAEEKDKDKVVDSIQVLEARHLDSQREMDRLNALDNIRTHNRQRERVNAVDVLRERVDLEQLAKEQEEDHAETEAAFAAKRNVVKRLNNDIEKQQEEGPPDAKRTKQEQEKDGVILVVAKKKKKKKCKEKTQLSSLGIGGYGSDSSSSE